LIFTQTKEIHKTTNIEAELRAILEDTRYCKSANVHNTIIETDSLGVVRMIQKQWIPWEINDMIEEIRENMHITHAQITHIFREGNQLADFLVNHAMDNEGFYTMILLQNYQYKQEKNPQ